RTRCGRVPCLVNPASAPAELAGLIGQVGPKAILTDSEMDPSISEGDAGARLVIDVHGLGARRPDQPLPARQVSPDDRAVLIPTSATTGRSKLVMQTHRAYTLAAEGFPYWMELSAADRLMTSLP